MNKKPAQQSEKKEISKFKSLPNVILISIFFLFIVLFTTFKISGDDDIFWHLETGKYITENKSIPSADVFGFATAGQRWIPFEWGWDVISYLIYSFSGFIGLSIFRTLIFIAVFSCYIKLIKKQNLSISFPLILFVILMFGTIDRLNPKPQIISYLFISILLYLLISFQSFNRKKIKTLYPIPLIFLVWCNMHMGVIEGALILIVFILTETLCYFRPVVFQGQLIPLNKKQFSQLVFLCSASIFLLLANPFGMNTYQYVYSHLNMKMLEDVFEWYSPFNKAFSGSMFQFIYYFFLLCAAVTVYYSYKIGNYFVMVISAVLMVFSFGSSRYVIDFMIAISLLTAVTLGNILVIGKNKRVGNLLGSQVSAITISLVILLIVLSLPGNQFYVLINYPRSTGFGVDSRDYPEKMIGFMKANNIQNIGLKPFNSFNIGGYFIHQLGGKRNFIDSRNLSDDNYYKYKSINNKLPGFEKEIDEIGFDYFAWFYPGLAKNSIEMKTSIVSYLIEMNDKWKLIYWDDNSFLFVKNEEKFRDIINRYEYKYVNPLYYIYEREPLKKAISEHNQEVVREIQRKYKDEPEGNFINSIARTFNVPVSR